jgi:hypothetical protein
MPWWLIMNTLNILSSYIMPIFYNVILPKNMSFFVFAIFNQFIMLNMNFQNKTGHSSFWKPGNFIFALLTLGDHAIKNIFPQNRILVWKLCPLINKQEHLVPSRLPFKEAKREIGSKEALYLSLIDSGSV